MEKSHKHLQIQRSAPQTQRLTRNFRPPQSPENPQAHATGLKSSLQLALCEAEKSIGGFDKKLLLKFQLQPGHTIPPIESIPGIELVSHEDNLVIVAFATEKGIQEFRDRLTSLENGGPVTRKEIFYAMRHVDCWSSEDRIGNAIKEFGFPKSEKFTLDVEFWPQERFDLRQKTLTAFRAKLATQVGTEIIDDMIQPSLIMMRLRTDQKTVDELILRYRDVRTVDLPPRTGITAQILHTDINTAPPMLDPPPDAPKIGVLDAGIISGHPMLGSAIGEACGYVKPHRRAEDTPPHWHGTFVAGIALHEDIETTLRQKKFTPQLNLFSGKVFEDDGSDQHEFVEKSVEEAVRDLNERYGCRIFNLSYGDLNKVYDGRHVRGLAYTLDRLTRELDVLFIVPTGNQTLSQLPTDVREVYPQYLLDESRRLLDPATALNVLTIGGLARHTLTRNQQRNEQQLSSIPIATEDQPFPLTRRGPSVNGAIKPDLVAVAGNVAVARGGQLETRGLGVMSTSGGFASGQPFSEDSGTSFSAPQVAHKAARILSEWPKASANLIRALLGAHARWPDAAHRLLDPSGTSEGKDALLKLLGYGKVNDQALFKSLDRCVSLIAEERIANDKCHFYEVPIPEEFWSSGKRCRELSIALAHSPDVRTTRMDYRATKMSFRLISADNLAEAEQAYSRGRDKGDGIPEISNRDTRWLGSRQRDASTLQVSRWKFRVGQKQPKSFFIVVTRQDMSWNIDKETPEPYALVAVLDDKDSVSLKLYAQIEAQLTLRQRSRVRT